MIVSPQFERDKFRELIVYIAQKTADDSTWGDTKLNKVLYWADFFGFSHLGHPVTGARYQKLPNGPAPRALKPVREELVEEGAVQTEMKPAGAVKRRRTTSLRDPDLSLFSSDELELVDSLIDQLWGKTAAEVSDLSHTQSVGWQIVDLYDDIPYETALVSMEPPSDDTLALGRKLAAERGW